MPRIRQDGDGPKCKVCGKPAVWSGFCEMADGKGYCGTISPVIDDATHDVQKRFAANAIEAMYSDVPHNLPKPNATLTQQLDEFERLVQLMSDEEVSDDDGRVIAELEHIEANIKDKVDGYCDVIRKFKAYEYQASVEATRYANRAKMWEKKQKMLTERLKQALERIGEKRMVTPKNTITICANGGAQPVNIFGDVPAEYLKVVTQPDRDLIRMALQHGDDLPFAKLGDRGTHLRIS